MRLWRFRIGALILALVLGTATIGYVCQPAHGATATAPNLRPSIAFTLAPAPLDSVFYSVMLQWVSSDDDGTVDHHLYAIDPPAAGDTAWVETQASSLTHAFGCRIPTQPLQRTGPVVSSDFHVFVVKAVDNLGLASAPVFRAFTTFTIAPETRITSPIPSKISHVITLSTFDIHWDGEDIDGVMSQEPAFYKTKLVPLEEIQSALSLGEDLPTAIDLQDYFVPSLVLASVGWDSIATNLPSARLTGLTPGAKYYFAVAAFDEAKAFEPRFLPESNVLQIQVTDVIQVVEPSWGRMKAQWR